MSISRDFDAWMDERGIVAEAEVIPDHACQVFLPMEGVRISLKQTEGEQQHNKSARLEAARAMVSDLLG
ncbi:hypothetical protein N24_2569 [Corynebacterium suranareeae]|uniref:Uncharacterized protein n=1 Tax=Corynebacterium suranareeae TaxID=2506452 RepID=A0A160PUL9_9CORY|nr:hypothetical protein [Corynebacterium suranareeae]BAU96831.1 hypothetical protein N24_2569 [Corynebacterium suranareeae]